VLRELEVIERGAGLWERICHACRAVIVALYPDILHNLPKKCDQREPIVVQRDELFSERAAPVMDLPGSPVPPSLLAPLAPDPISRQTNIAARRDGQAVMGPTQRAACTPSLREQLLAARRQVGLSLNRPARRLVSPPPARLPPINTEEEDAAEPNPEIPPIKLTKRYFQILGIDIIIDDEMNPQVLELNSRPSLGVAVDFERELKQSVIADAFEHVLPDGEVRGDSPVTSRWRKIYPVPGSAGRTWRAAIDRVMNPVRRAYDPPMAAPPVSHRSRVGFGQMDRDKKKTKRSVDRSSG
jgi:hypothetical protein